MIEDWGSGLAFGGGLLFEATVTEEAKTAARKRRVAEEIVDLRRVIEWKEDSFDELLSGEGNLRPAHQTENRRLRKLSSEKKLTPQEKKTSHKDVSWKIRSGRLHKGPDVKPCVLPSVLRGGKLRVEVKGKKTFREKF